MNEYNIIINSTYSVRPVQSDNASVKHLLNGPPLWDQHFRSGSLGHWIGPAIKTTSIAHISSLLTKIAPAVL